VRSLLSEGRVRYETVEKTLNGLKPRLIEREGPTGLLVTTTLLTLRPENETRLLSLTICDTPEQTRNVLLAQADGSESAATDFNQWHALQRWLESGPREVVVPFARALALKIPPVAIRLRRDFPAILSLICAHALLHQANRQRTASGQIVATLEDYSAVRQLAQDVVAEGVEATVSETVRQTVMEVAGLREKASSEVTIARLAQELRVDKSTASRRVREAVGRGYLKNLEDRRGRPARLALGDPLPEKLVMLPAPEDLTSVAALQAERQGYISPPPPSVPFSGGVPSGRQDEFEERAAIIEYEGGLSREQAEAAAFNQMAARMRGAWR